MVKADRKLPVLADRKRTSYRAAGAKLSELLGPKSVTRGLAHTVRSGGRVHQGRTTGHPAQLGGAMVVAPDGAVAWSRMSDDASDNASPEQLLAAARRAAVG